MRLIISALFVILIPTAGFTQQVTPTSAPDRAPSVAIDRAERAAATAPRSSEQPALMQGPFPLRRRGSMVGYVDDAIIESKVRVRFDAGLHNTSPDRAEYFYAKCGCYRDLPANHVAYDPDAPGPGPGAATDLNFQQLNIWAEYAVSNRFSVFGQVPVRWLQPKAFAPGTGAGFPDQSGLSDLRGGVKAGLAAAEDLAVTTQVQFYFPTGDSLKGLGTDHSSIEPALLYYQRANRVAIESQFGMWIPLGGSAGVPHTVEGKFSGNVLYYGIGPSVELYSSDRVQFAPVVELVGWHVLGGYDTVQNSEEADGINVVNIKIGARTTFGRGSFYFGYGHALTDTVWYEDIFRFEYRIGF